MSSIVRVHKESNYAVIDKHFLNNKKLSWKAKGIMAYMLSKPDDWTFYLDELVKHSTDGKASFRSGFNELQEQGYVKRIRKRNDKGTFDWETIVHERPHTDSPHVDKPHVDKPHVDNRTLLNNNQLSNDELSNDIPYVEIVTYLNGVAGKNYRSSTRKTKDLIKARWNEGFTLDDFKKVIDIKNNEWKNDDKMSKFIRPDTLFGTKFEGYLNQEQPTPPGGYDPNKDAF